MSLNAAIHLLRIDDTPKELGAELRSVILRLLMRAEIHSEAEYEETIKSLVAGYLSLMEEAGVNVRTITGRKADDRWCEMYGRAYRGKDYDAEEAGANFGPCFDWTSLPVLPESLFKDVAEAKAVYDRQVIKHWQKHLKEEEEKRA